MKLKHLHIENIASIELADIDFTSSPLSDSHLFVITGETGAGKSTLIDAICLALYGSTPRLSAAAKERMHYGNDETTPQNAANMLRHGTSQAEITLTFDINEKAYTAQWTVRRTRTGTLQSASHRLFSSDEEYANSQAAKKVAELVGLDFDQFCRTTILAQGEFARFIKSRPNEKASLLEKMAHTEIYSKLGASIFQHFQLLEGNLNNARVALQSIGATLLSDDERALKQQQLNQLRKESPVAEHQLNTLDQQAKLMADINKLHADQQQLNSQIPALETLFRNALKSFNSLQYEAQQSKQELGQLAQKQEEETGRIDAQLKEVASASAVAQQQLNTQQQALQALHPEDVDKETTQLNSRQSAIEDARQILVQSTHLNERRKEALAEIEQHTKQLSDYQQKISTLTEEKTRQEASLTDLEKVYEAAKLRIGSAAKQLRAQLKQGDICPVCGNKILTLIDEKAAREALQPIEDRILADRRALQDTSTKLSTLQHAVTTDLPERIAKQTSISDEAKLKIDSLRPRYIELLSGLQLPHSHSISEATADLEKAKSDLNTLLDKNAEKRKQITLQRTLTDQAAANLNQLIRQESQLRDQLSQLKHKHLEQHNALQKRIETLSSNIQTILQHRNYILQQWPQWNTIQEPERAPSAATALTDWIQLRDHSQSLYTRLSDLQQRLADAPSFSDEQRTTLAQQHQEAKAHVEQINRSIGALENALANDDANRNRTAKQQLEVDRATTELDQWRPLNDMFGDKTGLKFQRIAQSFVLGDLVERANGYLTHLSRRYRLDCEPGTLNLRMTDLYQENCQMPVDLLSGGESFLCSLALALALSSVNRRGFSIDTLFIDEGFGSLGQAELELVINLLQRLHELNGKRVGVISHIKELEERIPVHIEVSRTDPTRSRVNVVDRSA